MCGSRAEYLFSAKLEAVGVSARKPAGTPDRMGALLPQNSTGLRVFIETTNHTAQGQ